MKISIKTFDEFINEAESESFNDYPKAASKNAQRALDWRDEHGDEVKAGTAVGWTRANQLAKRENISFETVKRMKAFFDRHQKNKTIAPENRDTPWRDNGHVAWLLWGGDEAYEWAKRKIEKLEEADNVDWDAIFNMSPEDEAQALKDFEREEKERLEQKYQKNSKLNKRRLGKTREEAIHKLVSDVKNYYEIEKDWTNRVYKQHGGTATIGKHSEYEMRDVSIDRANEKRRLNRIQDAQEERWGALEILKRDLEVSKEELDKLLISLGVNKKDIENYLEISATKSFKKYKY